MNLSAMINWTAVVGIAGIAGTLGGIYFTNTAAKQRLRMQQEFEDSRRFHRERVELYARILGTAQVCRIRFVEARIAAHHAEEGDIPVPDDDSWQLMIAAMLDFTTAAKTVSFLGAPETREAARKFLEGMSKYFGMVRTAGDKEFKECTEALRNAESTFAEAARAELFPTGSAPGSDSGKDVKT